MLARSGSVPGGRAVGWDGTTLSAWAKEIDGADVVINLAGRSVTEALLHDGQPAESAWPYLPETPDPTAWTPPEGIDPTHNAALEFSDRTLGQRRARLGQAVVRASGANEWE